MQIKREQDNQAGHKGKKLISYLGRFTLPKPIKDTAFISQKEVNRSEVIWKDYKFKAL